MWGVKLCHEKKNICEKDKVSLSFLNLLEAEAPFFVPPDSAVKELKAVLQKSTFGCTKNKFHNLTNLKSFRTSLCNLQKISALVAPQIEMLDFI